MKFARRAKWLTHIFTPSVTPATSFPDSYSRDVSLVAPYDGGGWGMVNPERYLIQVSGTVSAASTATIFDVPVDSIYRWMAGSVLLLAGVAPTAVFEVFTIAGSVSMTVSDVLTPVTARHLAFLHVPPIVGPNIRIRGSWTGGDAATQVMFTLYGVQMPLGSSPTI